MGDIISTMRGNHQYIVVFNTVGNTISNAEDVQYVSTVGDIISTMKGNQQYIVVFNTVGDTISNAEDVQYCGGYHQKCGGCSVLWSIPSVMRRMFNTVEDTINRERNTIKTEEDIQ